MEKVKFDKELSENEEVKTVLFVELEGTMFNEGTMKKDYEDDNFKIGGDDDNPDEADIFYDAVDDIKELEKDVLGTY